MKLATLCYLKQNGHTLMLHKARGYQKGKWNGLGGKFHPGETPEECLVREVKEESGLDLKSYQLKGFLTFPMFDGEDDWYTFVYVGTSFTGELCASSEGELHWIADDDLLDLNLYDGDRIFIPWLAQEKFFSGKFVYQGETFLHYDVIFHEG